MNLVSNVLDVPELFWSEASLKGLYDAVREYLEIGPRVGVLNERLSVANDLVRCVGATAGYMCTDGGAVGSYP